MVMPVLNPGWKPVSETPPPTTHRPHRFSRRRLAALLIPPGHDPVMASPATLIWVYLLIFPGFILLNRSGDGPLWWLGLAASGAALAALPLRFRAAGDGRARPLVFGLINAALLVLHMGLTLALLDSVRPVLIIYAALPAIVVMMTPRVHSPRNAVVIILLLDVALLALAAWSQMSLGPEQALLWSDILVLVVPLAIVTYTNIWIRRHRHAQAAAIRSITDTAQRDTLTGLANRHGLVAAAGPLLARAQRQGRSAGLLLADMDGLKDINDSFGHAVGDAALRSFGETLRRHAGPDDVVARLGGDEFALLLVGAPGQSIEARAEDFAAALTATAYRDITSGRSMMLSASWGVAGCGPDGETLETLLAAADERLLWHKSRPRTAAAERLPLAELFVPRGRRALADALAALMAAAREVATAANSHDFLTQAAARAGEITGATTATVTLVDGDQTHGFRATRGQDGWVNTPSTFPGWSSIAGHVLRSGEPYLSNDLRHDPIASQEAVARLGLYNCVCVPMRTAQGTVVGIVFLSNKQGHAPFSELDVSIAQAFSDLATTALSKPLFAAQDQPPIPPSLAAAMRAGS